MYHSGFEIDHWTLTVHPALQVQKPKNVSLASCLVLLVCFNLVQGQLSQL